MFKHFRNGDSIYHPYLLRTVVLTFRSGWLEIWRGQNDPSSRARVIRNQQARLFDT